MRRLADGIVEFIIGDDVWIAVGVVGLLAAAAVVVHVVGDAWWLLLLGVPATLWMSLLRARRAAGSRRLSR